MRTQTLLMLLAVALGWGQVAAAEADSWLGLMLGSVGLLALGHLSARMHSRTGAHEDDGEDDEGGGQDKGTEDDEIRFARGWMSPPARIRDLEKN